MDLAKCHSAKFVKLTAVYKQLDKKHIYIHLKKKSLKCSIHKHNHLANNDCLYVHNSYTYCLYVHNSYAYCLPVHNSYTYCLDIHNSYTDPPKSLTLIQMYWLTGRKTQMYWLTGRKTPSYLPPKPTQGWCWNVESCCQQKNMDDEKQIETQWAKNWSTPLWAII